ncbi:hypothetical protein ABZP36_023900 [Zizania latifolia]
MHYSLYVLPRKGIHLQVTITGTSTGLSVIAKHLLEQKSSHIPKSLVHHMVPSQPAEDANQSSTPENDGIPVSEFTRVQEINQLDARVDDSNKISAGVIEVPKVVNVKGNGHSTGQTSFPQSPMKKIAVSLLKPSNKYEAADLLGSQGSTRNIPVVVLDADSDERAKGLEKTVVLDQLIQEKNKTRLSLGLINLSCAELPQERLLSLDEPSVYKLPDQWHKEQKNLLGADLLQSTRASDQGPLLPSHISEHYAGSSSWSGCLKSTFLSAQTDLSLGDMYLRSAYTREKGQHHLSSLGILNLHANDHGPRKLSLGGFPVASSPYGRSSGKRRRTTKLHKSYYDNKALWCQDPSERVSHFVNQSQEPINNLPEWLNRDEEMAGISRLDAELWLRACRHLASHPFSLMDR